MKSVRGRENRAPQQGSFVIQTTVWLWEVRAKETSDGEKALCIPLLGATKLPLSLGLVRPSCMEFVSEFTLVIMADHQ